MARKPIVLIGLLVVVVGVVLGATVFREPLATAATTPFQNVIVMNTTAQAVPVGVQPTLTNRFVFDGSMELGEVGPSFTVPAGKVLVVEHINLSASADTDRTIGVNMIYVVGGSLAPGSERVTFMQFPLQPGPASPHSNHTNYGYDENPNIKIGAGTVNFGLGRQDGTDFAAAIVSLSGYLVDAP